MELKFATLEVKNENGELINQKICYITYCRIPHK